MISLPKWTEIIEKGNPEYSLFESIVIEDYKKIKFDLVLEKIILNILNHISKSEVNLRKYDSEKLPLVKKEIKRDLENSERSDLEKITLLSLITRRNVSLSKYYQWLSSALKYYGFDVGENDKLQGLKSFHHPKSNENFHFALTEINPSKRELWTRINIKKWMKSSEDPHNFIWFIGSPRCSITLDKTFLKPIIENLDLYSGKRGVDIKYNFRSKVLKVQRFKENGKIYRWDAYDSSPFINNWSKLAIKTENMKREIDLLDFTRAEELMERSFQILKKLARSRNERAHLTNVKNIDKFQERLDRGNLNLKEIVSIISYKKNLDKNIILAQLNSIKESTNNMVNDEGAAYIYANNLKLTVTPPDLKPIFDYIDIFWESKKSTTISEIKNRTEWEKEIVKNSHKIKMLKFDRVAIRGRMEVNEKILEKGGRDAEQLEEVRNEKLSLMILFKKITSDLDFQAGLVSYFQKKLEGLDNKTKTENFLTVKTEDYLYKFKKIQKITEGELKFETLYKLIEIKNEKQLKEVIFQILDEDKADLDFKINWKDKLINFGS